MRKLVILGTLLALACTSAATAQAPGTRYAPWRLTGISADGRALRLVYQGSGCYPRDGRPEVDASVAGEVAIRVVQSDTSGPYIPCPLFLAAYPLRVPLDAPLAGRFVTGGPAFDITRSPRTVPRLIGLRKTDARRAARGQSFTPRFDGARVGVVVSQSPRPGTRLDIERGFVKLRMRVGAAK